MQEHLAGNFQKLHHGFVDSIEQAMVLLKKMRAGNDNKISPHKSDECFRSGGCACYKH